MEGYRPIDPDKRGRHGSFSSAVDAAFTDLITEKNAFFDSLVDNWKILFADIPARPGRYEDGKIFIYVKNAPLSFAVRPKLREIARRLSQLPLAPRKIDLRLEIHSR